MFQAFRSLLICAVALAVPGVAHSAVMYDIIEIPPLQGMDSTMGTAIADVDVVAFVSRGSVMGVPTANGAVCRWSPKGCMGVTDLGLIGDGGTGVSATVYAITRDGRFVAGTRQTKRPRGPNQAFLQRTEAKGGGIPARFDLLGLAAGQPDAAFGITADDEFVTGSANNKNGVTTAVIWKIASEGKLEAQLHGFDGQCAAYGGSSRLWVVGLAFKAKAGDRAVKWDNREGKPVEFPAPPHESIASSANAGKDAIGVIFTTNGSIGAYLPFGGKLITFGTGFETQARSINDGRMAVGNDRKINGNRAATLWDLNAAKIVGVDLNTQIDPKLGWVLESAFGINSKGVIVGTGELKGKTRGFVLIPKKK